MKISDVTVEGFYWHRADEHRPWTIVFIGRQASNPVNVAFNNFIIESHMSGLKDRSYTYAANSSRYKEHEVIGPIDMPN